MKSLPALSLILALATTPAWAETQPFEEMMALAYRAHPALSAERARLRSIEEGVTQAQAGYLPTIEAGAGIGRSAQKMEGLGDSQNKALAPRDVGIDLVQPLFRGGRTVGAVAAAKAQAQAAKASLRSAEQAVLLAAATAYLDVLKSRSVLDLVQRNEAVLKEQLAAAERRFQVGEVTKTDVSQAQARVAAAQAARLRAEGDMVNDRARFARHIGRMPETLEQPRLSFVAPSGIDEVLAAAEKENPELTAASYGQESAKAAITTARGALLPEVNLVGSASRRWEQDIAMPQRRDEATLMARVSVPLYRGGADYARLRAAREEASQTGFVREDARQQVRQQAQEAWQGLLTARAALAAHESQIKAGELALYGVQEEAKVGTRTTLDILDAEQELLTARVERVKAQRDEAVALLSLQSVMGLLTPESLGLPKEKDS